MINSQLWFSKFLIYIFLDCFNFNIYFSGEEPICVGVRFYDGDDDDDDDHNNNNNNNNNNNSNSNNNSYRERSTVTHVQFDVNRALCNDL